MEVLLKQHGTLCNAWIASIEASEKIGAQIAHNHHQLISGWISDTLAQAADYVKNAAWKTLVTFRIPQALDPLISRLKDLSESASAKAIKRALKFISDSFDTVWEYLNAVLGKLIERTQEESEAFFSMTVPGFVGEIVLNLIKTFATGLYSLLTALRDAIYGAVTNMCDAVYGVIESAVSAGSTTVKRTAVRAVFFTLTYTNNAIELVLGGKRVLEKTMDVFSRRFGVITHAIWNALRLTKEVLPLPQAIFDGIENAFSWVMDHMLWLSSTIKMLVSCASTVFGGLFSVTALLAGSEQFKQFFDKFSEERSKLSMDQMRYELEKGPQTRQKQDALRILTDYATHKKQLRAKRINAFLDAKDTDITSVADDAADVLMSQFFGEEVKRERFENVLSYRLYGEDIREYKYAKIVELVVSSTVLIDPVNISINGLGNDDDDDKPETSAVVLARSKEQAALLVLDDEMARFLATEETSSFAERQEMLQERFQSMTIDELARGFDIAERRYESSRVLTEMEILATARASRRATKAYIGNLDMYVSAIRKADAKGELDQRSPDQKSAMIRKYMHENAYRKISGSVMELNVLEKIQALYDRMQVRNMLAEELNRRDQTARGLKEYFYVVGTLTAAYVCLEAYMYFIYNFNSNPTLPFLDNLAAAADAAAVRDGGYWSSVTSIFSRFWGGVKVVSKSVTPPTVWDAIDFRHWMAYIEEAMNNNIIASSLMTAKYALLLGLLKTSIPGFFAMFYAVQLLIVGALFMFVDLGGKISDRAANTYNKLHPWSQIGPALLGGAFFGVAKTAAIIGTLIVSVYTTNFETVTGLFGAAAGLLAGGTGIASLVSSAKDKAEKGLATMKGTKLDNFRLADDVYKKIMTLDLRDQMRGLVVRDFSDFLNAELEKKYILSDVYEFADELKLEAEMESKRAVEKTKEANRLLWKD